MPLKVIPIGTPNLKDVPASLRMLAEKIESGDLPEAVHAIVVAVDADEAITIYGYGEVGTCEKVDHPLIDGGWVFNGYYHRQCRICRRIVSEPVKL